MYLIKAESRAPPSEIQQDPATKEVFPFELPERFLAAQHLPDPIPLHHLSKRHINSFFNQRTVVLESLVQAFTRDRETTELLALHLDHLEANLAHILASRPRSH